MGIKGLLQFLKDQQKIVNLKTFRGCTAAVDVYCWLHKAVYGCVEQIAIAGNDQGQYIKYCEKYWNVLLSNGIKPILVFDGQNLPAKSHTEKERRERRKANRDRANALLAEGKKAEARQYFERCIDITPQMAHKVIVAAVSQGIDCIVAPYEADAELAYLSRSGIAQLIISEDSDLMCFGCERVIFKLDLNGNGIMQEQSGILEHKSFRKRFTFEHFVMMCILSGCDYIPSLPGIGLAKACKYMSQVNNCNDIQGMLRRLPLSIKLPQGVITDEYIEKFTTAVITFKHQVVFDPRTRKRMPLTPNTDTCCSSGHPEDMSFAGRYVPAQQALQIALGNINLHNMDVLLPEIDPDLLLSRANGKLSMWHPDYQPKGQWNAEDFRSIDRSAHSTKDKSVLVPTNRIVRKRVLSQTETDDIVSSLCNEDVVNTPSTSSSNNTQRYPGDGFSSVEVTTKSPRTEYSKPTPAEEEERTEEDPVNQALDDLDHILSTSTPALKSAQSRVSESSVSSANKFSKDKLRSIYHTEQDTTQEDTTPKPLIKSRYFGSSSSTPQPAASPERSQCDDDNDGTPLTPAQNTSGSGTGYKAKFLGALDELEKNSTAQSRVFKWSKSSLHQHIKEEGDSISLTSSPLSQPALTSSQSANQQYKSPLLKSRIVSAVLQQQNKSGTGDGADLPSPSLSKRVNPFRQSTSLGSLHSIGLSEGGHNPFKKSSNSDLHKDTVLGKAVKEEPAKVTEKEDIFSLKSLHRIGTKIQKISVTQRLNVFKKSPSKGKVEAVTKSEPTELIDLSDGEDDSTTAMDTNTSKNQISNETTPKTSGNDAESTPKVTSSKKSSKTSKKSDNKTDRQSGTPSITDMLTSMARKRASDQSKSDSKRTKLLGDSVTTRESGGQTTSESVELGSDDDDRESECESEEDTTSSTQQIHKKSHSYKPSGQSVGLSKRLSNFSSIIKSGTSSSPDTISSPAASSLSVLSEPMPRSDRVTESAKDSTLEPASKLKPGSKTSENSKENENKSSAIKNFLAQFSRKSDKKKTSISSRPPLSPTNNKEILVDLT